MQLENRTEAPIHHSACIMTRENIHSYIEWEKGQGASPNAIRRCKRFAASLYEWLPADKEINRQRLRTWRKSLRQAYSPTTEQNYIKGINRYLDYMGFSALRFNRSSPKDIAGQQFGYLTALEPTGEKSRRDYIWRCRCQCGKEVEFPATRLLTGNTLSCGCLRGEHLKKVNQYIGGTSLRMAMDEKVYSARAESGYTGVTRKGDKWKAYIMYKGRNYSLGCYSRLEDAVKARAWGKEQVQRDAAELLESYAELHKDDPQRPKHALTR